MTKQGEILTNIICKCRKGSMDDKQYKATVENAVQKARAEERARVVGIAKGMKKERTADRQLYTWDGKVEQIKYFHNDSDVGYNNAVMDFITSLENL